MPVNQTKVSIATALSAGYAYRLMPNAPGDFGYSILGSSVAPWLAAVGDLNGDGLADLVVGASGDDDKAIDAGRVFIHLGQATGGTSTVLTGTATDVIIDGVNAGDQAGSAVGAVGDLNGNGKGEVLVGARGMDNGAAVDAGAAFVLWNPTPGSGIDLADPYSGSGNGKGYAIKGAAAGDLAGTAVLGIADLNGDGKSEVLVGATGVDAGGLTDRGAVYVTWGKSSEAAISLALVAAGTGGYRIVGADGGDAVGSAVATSADMNGDGKSEILIGASQHGAAARQGAAYVVFGNAGGAEVNLADVAAGVGGFAIVGAAGDLAGASISSVGDVNGDGRPDILIGASGSNSAYLVFGKSTGSAVDLANLGSAGLRIVGESAGDLAACPWRAAPTSTATV